MYTFKLILLSVVCATTVFCYSCHSDGSSYYHADVSTGCQVYHYCNNGEMTTLTCPAGQAFDQHSGGCKDASSVHCVETDHHDHHRRKRSVTPAVHSIEIDELKEGLKKLYSEVKDIVEKSANELVPTVYDQIKENYVPIVKEWKADVVPFYKEKVVPHLKKSYAYAKKLYVKLADKVKQSWEMSNSTHINIVSFADVAKEVSSDMEPVMKLGRYLSARLTPTRPKRQLSNALDSPNVPVFDKLLSCFREAFL